MMAADSNMTPARFFVLLYLVSVAFSSASSQTEEKESQCNLEDTYKHDGRDCCLCSAGQYLVEHCITSLHFGKCKHCDSGTYNSHPNYQMPCEPCTSCSHPNENLEEEETCTPARDAKCRCKRDHYCVSNKETCRLCHPCKKCADGIKEACTATNNTVCNDKIEGGNIIGILAGTFVIVFIILAGVAVYIWRRRQLRKRQNATDHQTNGNATDVEMQLLRVDIQPHLPDIAEVIGWKDMRDIAMRSGIPSTTIDSCRLNYPGDCQEQTLQLLRTWEESQGKKASMNLIQNLQNSGKKGKAERVINILSHGRSNLPA